MAPAPVTRSRLLAACLVLALVLAQALGFAHRYVHSAATGGGAHAAAHAHGEEADGDTGGWLASLFAGHEQGKECRLLDSVAHDALAVACLPLLHAVAPLRVIAALHGDFVARWAALFDARGPPASR